MIIIYSKNQMAQMHDKLLAKNVITYKSNRIQWQKQHNTVDHIYAEQQLVSGAQKNYCNMYTNLTMRLHTFWIASSSQVEVSVSILQMTELCIVQFFIWQKFVKQPVIRDWRKCWH